MKAVTLRKEEVLAIIRENREKHRSVFEAALQGFQETLITQLEQRLELAKQGKPIELYIRLDQPQDHTIDYDRIIRMLEMSIDEEIPFDEESFTQYVQDDWAWKRAFITNSTQYAAGATRAAYGDQ